MNGKGKGGKYLEKKNVFFAEEKNNPKGRESFARGRSIWMIICKRPVFLDDHLHLVVVCCLSLAVVCRWSLFVVGSCLSLVIVCR